jgi:tRNA nucleotidyltransferase (CCA-adding enzyme)
LEEADVDVVVEGDAGELAEAIAGECGGTAVRTAKFGTAAVFRADARLDMAGTRSETYRRPGALPDVASSGLAEDLHRRDFTVNAIALTLNGAKKGALIDPESGRADLEERLIRVIHDRSFIDDPTRIIRAARLAARLGFAIEPRTEALLKDALPNLAAVSGMRLRREFELIFQSDSPVDALRYLDEIGALAAVHPALAFSPAQGDQLIDLPEWSDAAWWCLLAWDAQLTEIEAMAGRLALPRKASGAVRAIPSARTAEEQLPSAARDSEAAGILRDIPAPTLIALACATENEVTRSRVLDFLRRMRSVRSSLRGRELIEAGVPEGRLVGEMLDRLVDARLDGEVSTRAGEMELVVRWLKEGEVAGVR